jgi:DHA1 family bicyclomycin/chloramphenicol resistance-like MFS transporter
MPRTLPAIDDFKHRPAFLWLLVGLMAIQPATSDLYIPALPSLAQAFGASAAQVTWTMSAMVGAFGLSQLYIGPLADRWGRRPVMLAGLALHTASSFGALLAPGIEWLIVCRMLQGLGVSCAFVVARAMVRDLYEPEDGARVMARAFTYMALMPLVGPFIGGLLTQAVGWRGPFVLLGGFSLLVLAGAWPRLAESNRHRNPHATDALPLARNYAQVLRHPTFLAHSAATVATYGGLFAFLSGSAFVFIDGFGWSRPAFGLAFSAAVLGYLIGTAWCRRHLARHGIVRSMVLGGTLSAAAGLTALALWLAGVVHPLAVLLPQFAYMVAHGFVQPCGQTGCVAPFARMAGAASAMNGCLQMALAVAVGAWIGAQSDGSPRAWAWALALASLGVALASVWAVPRWGRVEPAAGAAPSAATAPTAAAP